MFRISLCFGGHLGEESEAGRQGCSEIDPEIDRIKRNGGRKQKRKKLIKLTMHGGERKQ